MTTSQHGGARPATRPDDGRHHNGGHTTAGRKPQSATLRLGDKLAVFQRDADGNPLDNGEYVWTVAEIDRTWLTLHSDAGTVIRLRR